MPVCTPKYKMRVKAPLHKHKQLKKGCLCAPKDKLLLKAPSHKPKELNNYLSQMSIVKGKYLDPSYQAIPQLTVLQAPDL